MKGSVKILNSNGGIAFGAREVYWLIALIFTAGVTYGSVVWKGSNTEKRVDRIESKVQKCDSSNTAKFEAQDLKISEDKELLIKINTNMEDLIIPSLKRIEEKVDKHIDKQADNNLAKK